MAPICGRLFDEKMKLIIGNPYDWNQIIQKRMDLKRDDLPSPEMAKINPNARIVGKFCNIDTTREWSQFYPKVWDLYQWARIGTKSDNIIKILGFLQNKLNSSPQMNPMIINDLHIAYKLEDRFGSEEKNISEAEEPEPEEETEGQEEPASEESKTEEVK